jgi:ABC-type sugar transport system, permease component
MRYSIGEKIFNAIIYIFIVLLSFSIVFPFWRIIVISFNDGIDLLRSGVNFWPRKFTLNNYIIIFSQPDIFNAYKVTIGRTVIGTVLSVFVTSMMAYGLSKKSFIGRKAINILILVTMFFSGGLIPYYLLLRDLVLLDKFMVYIIPGLYQAWNIILFRTFFRSMPDSMEESAKIDGANDIIVFFRIVFPLSLPIFATISLFIAVTHWNDWYSGTVFVSKQELVPLQTLLMRVLQQNDSARMIKAGASGLENMRNKNVTNYSIKMAIMVIAVVPIMCVYPFLQKYFVKGVLVGSIKG